MKTGNPTTLTAHPGKPRGWWRTKTTTATASGHHGRRLTGRRTVFSWLIALTVFVLLGLVLLLRRRGGGGHLAEKDLVHL